MYVLIHFAHRSKGSRILPELVSRNIYQMKADIASDKDFDAADLLMLLTPRSGRCSPSDRRGQ
jgi:hypothetical protein